MTLLQPVLSRVMRKPRLPRGRPLRMLALLLLMVPLLPESAYPPVIVDRSAVAGETVLATGITHTQRTVDDWNDPEAVERARSLITASVAYQNQHIMGWGALNPEPSPGEYDWEILDLRLEIIRATGGIPVLTLCCAPDWMKGGEPGTTDWTRLEKAPLPEHFDDFAALSAEVARRYPDVRYFQVWNELKGFWNAEENRWDYEGYTELYNAVYDALKAVDPELQVGGPYVVLNGTPGHYDRRGFAAMEYWLEHKRGADFIALNSGDAFNRVDSVNRNMIATAPFDYLDKLDEMVAWVRERSDLPIWWAEWYVTDWHVPEEFDHERQNAILTSAMIRKMRNGTAVSLRWRPQGIAGRPFDGNQESIWTDTSHPDGGRPFPFFRSLETIHRHFPPETPLHPLIGLPEGTEGIASPSAVILVNQSDGAAHVRLGSLPLVIRPESVEIVRWGR